MKKNYYITKIMLSIKWLSNIYILLLALIISGCSKTEENHGAIRVVTTTTMITDMLREIGGDQIKVSGLMGPGVDPHLYKASASDVSKLQNADAIFYSGLHLEGRMADLFVKMSRNGKKVWAISEDIPKDKLLEPPEFSGNYDPHIWFNPEIWTSCINTVVTALSSIDKTNAQTYQTRGNDLAAKYHKVHKWAKSRVEKLPPKNRVLITSHDAFNYFGKAYGFEVIGVQGISTVSEAGLADITKIIDFIKERKVKAIFLETSVSGNYIERISNDSGAIVGGEIFSDAMGAPGEIEKSNGESYDVGTYIGMIKHNVNTIVNSLGK